MAHELKEDVALAEPVLIDNKEKRIGYEAIDEYISELMKFKEAWFACSCG